MSGAKDRMRHKKMKNQPSNVTYSSPADWRNRGGTGGLGYDSPQHMRGPSQSGRPQQSCGWVRGRQEGVPPDQALPKYITASLFAKARSAEVSAMMKAITKTTASCHAFGALPKHMRRRAMSHNVKRLPCRLREAALRTLEKSQQAGQKEKKEQSKTKSRRARRRHGNLLLEFNRRQRKNKWLETHIWHAKRFHMLKTWGYSLGDRPTYKCYRASYRAMSSGCLLQDLSYHCCVELQGPEDKLQRALSRMTSKDTGPTFAGALYVSGQREGRVVLYRPDQYPHRPLGPAHFLWRPSSTQSSQRQLWIWVHPTLKQDLLSELQAVCECFVSVAPAVDTDVFEPQSATDTVAASTPPASEPQSATDTVAASTPPASEPQSATESVAASTPPASEPQLATDTVAASTPPASEPQSATDTVAASTPPASEQQHPGRKRKRKGDSNDGPPAKKIFGDGTRSPLTPVMWKSSTTDIVISDLTMEVVRYRLIGPLSHSVLTETLQPATKVDHKIAASPFWWPEECKKEEHMTLHQRQADVFHLLRGVSSTAELPAGCVLGLTVDDPRLNLPKKRGKVMADVQGSRGIDEEQMKNLTIRGIPGLCAQSALWDQSVRDNVTHNKISEQDLNRMKRDLLVPGSRLPPAPQGRVPVLLIHQAGRQQGEERPGWGAGWDLLLPKAWGMAFWVPLVYRGVRVGGLQMSLKHTHFKGMPHFPHDYPDCPAGSQFQEQQEAELLEKFKRRPPSKRTNYIKHGCLAPFRCPWQQLTEEWEEIVKQEPENHEGVKMEGVTSVSGVNASQTSAFTVLRSRKVLRQLSIWCRPRSARVRRLPRGCPLSSLSPEVAMATQAEWGRSLVWVRVCVLGKGRPAMHAMLSVPTAEDLQRLRGDPQFSGPEEPRHRDHLQHLLKKSKRRKATPKCAAMAAGLALQGEQLSRRTAVLKDHHPPPTTLVGKHPGSTHTVESSSMIGCSDSPLGLVRGLWPEPLPSVSSHCSRVTLGWVAQGDFSLATGGGEALGFVSLAGLLHTLLSQPADQRGTVLLRNPSSLQYRYARLHVEA